MKSKKIIFVSAICFSFIVCHQVSAAHLVPKNSPLQPIPQGSAPNVSNNINSPNGDVNTNLQSQIPAVGKPDQTPVNNDNTQTSTPDQTVPIVGNVSTTSTTFYWFLLIVGLAGLVAAGIWTYLRFVRKP